MQQIEKSLYNSPTLIKSFLEENNLGMQKKFGQNFLINGNARLKIADALEVGKNTVVWEIGPGLGAETIEILNRGAKVIAFEIDKGFIAALTHLFYEFTKNEKLVIIEGDVLKTWKKNYEVLGEPEVVFGNLPYNIASSFIADTIENGVRFNRAVFTVQKEVAMRAAAKVGTKDYSSFSILCQWAYNIMTLMDLGGANFWPRPNVDSRVIVMQKNSEFPKCKDTALFIKLQRALFSSRRKNIKNNLQLFIGDNEKIAQILQKSGINPLQRAETLAIDKILHLSDILADE